MMGQSCVSALRIMSSGKHFGLRRRDPPSSCPLGLAWHRPGCPRCGSASPRGPQGRRSGAQPGVPDHRGGEGGGQPTLSCLPAHGPLREGPGGLRDRFQVRGSREQPQGFSGREGGGRVRTHMAQVGRGADRGQHQGTGIPGVSLLRIGGNSSSTPSPPPPASHSADPGGKLPPGTRQWRDRDFTDQRVPALPKGIDIHKG